jgi:hypothetical protein
VAGALADPATREAAITEFRRALSRTRTVIPSLEFAARINREIGPGAGDGASGVVINFISNVDPQEARSRTFTSAAGAGRVILSVHGAARGAG